ncbi:heme peroxidase [Tuber magnatum]|uniref:Heme peroxidase n=1 Tax=Tuber magnatum TaxID=42249 RepID=A0A317STA0_9PEZI|nr:heme peroxidase [Tuber magnatum]
MASNTNGTNDAAQGRSNGCSNGASNGVSKAKTSKSAARAKPPPPVAKPTRAAVDNTFEQFANLLHASNRPLPNRSGDGKDQRPPEVKQTGVLTDINTLRRAGFFWESVGTLWDVLKGKVKGGLVDDKTMIMERVIQLTSRLPPRSKVRVALTTTQVGQLWDSLQHPPLSYLGDEFNYRQADGGYNNIMYPQLGRAGSAYGRSVKPMTKMPGAPPDAYTLFDRIFSRGPNDEHFREHDNNVSSMLFYTASIIIHDLFQTNRANPNISDTSSYLDLAPLYGNSVEDQSKIRTFQDGRIKPDSYCEKRLLAFPPGASVLLIMFGRFHNYVVENLKVINEGGRFDLKFPRYTNGDDEATRQEKALRQQDEDLFQTGRLVTCGLYINFILNDYLRTIVNLNRVDTTWTLDPRFEASKAYNPDGTPAGVGNMVSAEFNLVYRWHSCISKRDDQWTKDFYEGLFPGRDTRDIEMPEFLRGVGRWEASLSDDPLQRNVPHVLRLVEVLGIEQSRKWGVASLNEFREFFGLKPHATFEDINPDPAVTNTLRQLYDHPDFVEMYAGLVAEADKKPMVPGVGIGPTYTISRAILSDAVTLVRGDRFYTTYYTAAHLSNWGLQEASSDPAIVHGCVGYKLIIKAFPNHFKFNSIYAHYPLTIPEENHKIHTALNTVDQFDFERPVYTPLRIPISSYRATKQILCDAENFKVTWGAGFDFIMRADFMLSGDKPSNSGQKQFVSERLYLGGVDWKQQIRQFYEEVTKKLIRKKAYSLGDTYQVDAVRDIGNIAQTIFAASIFNLPMKSEDHPKGIYTEQELYMILCVMFIVVFFDVDPSKSFPLRQAGFKVVRQYGTLVEAQVKAIKNWSWLQGVWDPLNVRGRNKSSPLKSYGWTMIKRLLESGKSPYDVTWSYIVPTAGASAPNQGQIFAQVLDFYLEDRNAHHLAEIQRLAQLGTEEAWETIKKYALEGGRLAGTFGLYRRVEPDSITIEDNGRDIELRKGDMVFVSFITASRDPVVFPDPLQVKLDRPEASYMQYGDGSHECLGKEANIIGLTTMLMQFGKLEGLRRAPGPQGTLKYIGKPGGFKVYMKEDWSAYWPFPTTMKVRFDDII